MPPTSTPRHRNASKGNLNNFEHGFYSRRIKKCDLTEIESTDNTGLTEELGLIRVYTRRLVESFDPKGGFSEYADLLRMLCLASATITRIIRAQYLVSSPGSAVDDEIAEAIRQVHAEIFGDLDQPGTASTHLDPPPTSLTDSPSSFISG